MDADFGVKMFTIQGHDGMKYAGNINLQVKAGEGIEYSKCCIKF